MIWGEWCRWKYRLTDIRTTQQQQQASADDPKIFVWTRWLKISIQVAENDRRANAHHLKQIVRHFERSGRFMADLLSKHGHILPVFRTIVLKLQDDRQRVKQVSPTFFFRNDWTVK